MTNYQEKKAYWEGHFRHLLKAYSAGEHSFVQATLPEFLINLGTLDVLDILEKRLGNQFFSAINPYHTVASPVKNQPNSHWLKSVNMVGINVRTIGSFWNIIKYAFSLSEAQSSIHILPIWEPGVVASLYGMSSWHINPEFYSEELQRSIPALDTVEKQLKVVVNLLHAMGKTVGMDVIPHTDRYSEIVLANPAYFEWLRRKDFDITDHSANLHATVERAIMRWLLVHGSANQKAFPTDFFTFFYKTTEEFRVPILFGEKGDIAGRIRRRNDLISHLYYHGLEPLPATMGPPYRGLKVDPNQEAKTIDADGRIWRDYQITQPEKFSRAFGPLTRYKLYERKNDNQDWAIDFSKPRKVVWEYIKLRYGNIQAEYNFDFMRGDMSHVQMRPNGVGEEGLAFYDIHRSLKLHIQQRNPAFGYFAETFLAPPNEMAYGEEELHLELSAADTTLGDLQSMPVDSSEFMYHFHRYYQIGQSRSVMPNFTVMTADKDDPRFDSFYLHGNIARLFIAFFLDMPSYMGLGFETRDKHIQPAPNEQYTKLYVFQIAEGAKATNGPYQWGQNVALYQQIEHLKNFAATFLTKITGEKVSWLLPPDPNRKQKVIAWTYEHLPDYLLVVNLGQKEIHLSDLSMVDTLNTSNSLYECIFSTHNQIISTSKIIKKLVFLAGEGAVLQEKKETI